MKRVEKLDALKQTKHPHIVTFAIGKDEDGKYNPITLEWFMRTSINPLMFAISIGHTRYSYKCFQKNRFFNLVFPSKQQSKETILFGSKSGRDMDKLAESGLNYFAGRLAKYPIIKDAAAVYECKIVTQVRSGDHTIFVGEVKHCWIDEDKEVLLVSDL